MTGVDTTARRTIEVALGTSGLDANGLPLRAPLVVQLSLIHISEPTRLRRI